MLGLFGSAVSACACTHHQTKKAEVEPLSCHRALHGEARTETETATTDPGLPKFDEHCNCIIRTLEPAIVVKAETKLSKAERSNPRETPTIAEIDWSDSDIGLSDSIPFETLDLSSEFFLSAAPARAPPRL